MELDNLLVQFQSITTNDHEALVGQFSKVLQIDPRIAEFFLESSNWNVELAVNNYLNARAEELPVVSFLSDLSNLQTVRFAPGQTVPMEWVFRNDGPKPWPMQVRIVHVDGAQVQMQHEQMPQLMPQSTVTIKVEMIALEQSGAVASAWRLASPSGYFGDPIWVIFNIQGTDMME